MRLAVFPHRGQPGAPELPRWTRLPGLCCQAAGGYPEWADDLTVAWLLFYAAADLMDKVQDKDEPDPWWRKLGPGAALGAATGIYFSAALALNKLYHHPASRSVADEITENFYDAFLVMTSGQYRDIVDPPQTLERYWEIAAAKSGAFFGVACRSAARLAMDKPDLLQDYYLFGHHFGLLVQIRDDLEDLQAPTETGVPGQKNQIARSLAVVYALSVLPPADCQRLKSILAKAPHDPLVAEELIGLLNHANTALYLMAEMERQRQLALDAIHRAAQPSPAKEMLIAYLTI